MTTFLMVDVQSITSNVPRSNFLEADLDMLADMILESRGILKPIVIKKTGFERYEVVDGHFEYYAAVRAREKNRREGEMVNALIISPETEEAVVKQAAALKAAASPPPSSNEGSSRLTNLESRQTNLESRFETRIDELNTNHLREIQRIEGEIKEIKSLLPKQLEPLKAFNTLSITELTFRLRSAGLTDKAAKIAESVEIERKKKKFDSLSDVVARVKISRGKKQEKGISSDKMVAIVDSWSKLLFS